LATFEGGIRVGQEKAVIAEEITLTFGYVDAPPVKTESPAENAAEASAPSPSTPSPLQAALNA